MGFIEADERLWYLAEMIRLLVFVGILTALAGCGAKPKSSAQKHADKMADLKIQIANAWSAEFPERKAVVLNRGLVSPFEWTLDADKELKGRRWVVELWVEDVWQEAAGYMMEGTYMDEDLRMLLKMHPKDPLLTGTNRPFSIIAVVDITSVTRMRVNENDERQRTVKGELVDGVVVPE